MANTVEYVVKLTDGTKAGTQSAIRGSEQLEKQSRDTARAVDRVGDEAKETGRELSAMGRQSKAAGTNTAGLGQALRGAVSGAGALSAGVAGLTAALGVGALTGAISGAIDKVRAFGQEVADLRNDISDAATRSGIAAGTLEGLRLAAEGSGLTFGALTSSLDQFGARMNAARDGGNETAEAFAALGVSVVTSAGELRSGDEVFRETVEALNAMEPSAERSALALATMGRSGGKMLQALSGSELADFVALAEEFGVGVGPKAAASAGEWQRATAALGLVLDGVKGRIVDTFGGGASLMLDFAEAVIVSVEVIAGALGGLATAADKIATAIRKPFDSLVGAIREAVAAVQAVASGDLSGALAAADRFAGQVRDGVSAVGTLAGATNITATVSGAIGSAIGSGGVAGLATGRERAARFRELVDATGAPVGAPSGGFGGGGGGGSGGGSGGATPSTEGTATAGAPTFASGFAAERRRMSEVLAEGTDNLAAAMEQTAEEAAANRLKALNAAQSGIGIAGQALTGNIGGALMMGARTTGMAGLGVAGAAIGGLQAIGEAGAHGIMQTLDGLRNALVGAIEALPELIGRVLPTFAIELVASLIPALIEAGPALFRALIFELPTAIAEAIADILENAVSDSENAGRNIGAVIGGVAGFALGGPVGAAIGAGALGMVGQGVQRDIVGNAGRSARTAEAGQQQYARTSDRLGIMSSRPRTSPTAVRSNPFDELARQFDAQYGVLGRASSTTIKAST